MIGISEALERLLPEVPDGLADWEFFDLNEIELLPLVSEGKLDLAGLIVAKRADIFGRPRSLTNYLYFTNRELFRVKGDPSETRSKPWFPGLMDQFKKWGFPARGSEPKLASLRGNGYGQNIEDSIPALRVQRSRAPF
jgi:hypothetical protein